MTLSTQLRIILLLVGAAVWLAIYLLGRRRTRSAEAVRYAEAEPIDEPIEHTASFEDVTPLDEEAFDTPAYMRRQGIREPRQDYEPRIANADDYKADDYADDIDVHDEQYLNEVVSPVAQESDAFEPIYVEPVYADAAHAEPYVVEASLSEVTRREPVVELQEEFTAAEPPTLPNIPVIAEPAPVAQTFVRPERTPLTGPAMAPTLSMAVPPAPSQSGMHTRGADKPAEARRKIIALRLPMTVRVAGATLLELLQGERLEHGKFNIFHRMHEAGTVFSVASMVEPGSFNIDTMRGQEFPGVTLFMLLPGPLDGLVAYDQMMSCAQRLAHATGGVLHDERGSKLTPQAMERLREEVLDFQHLFSGV